MEQETLAAMELKRALFKKCHGLSLLTGCSVFLRIKDGEDGIQFYGTKDQVKRYISSKMKHSKDDQEISGETGLPKQEKKNCSRFTHVKVYKDPVPGAPTNNRGRTRSDDISSSTTNVTSSDSGHSSTSDVISISDGSNSESENDGAIPGEDSSETKSGSSSEQPSKTQSESASRNQDSSDWIHPRPLQIRDVMKEIIKRSESSDLRKSGTTSLGQFREKLTDMMLRRALLEQDTEEARQKQLEEASRENQETGLGAESPRGAIDQTADASGEHHATRTYEAQHFEDSDDYAAARKDTDLSYQENGFLVEKSDSGEQQLHSYRTNIQQSNTPPQGYSFRPATTDDIYRESEESGMHQPLSGEDSDQNQHYGRDQHLDDEEQCEPLDFSRKRVADEDSPEVKYMRTSEMQDCGDVGERRESNGSSNGEASPEYDASSEMQFLKISSKAKRRFQCGLCGKAFTQLSVLKEHVKTHTGEKPYTCKICGKEFSHPSNFKRHERLVHSGPNETRRHQCPVCLKAFPLSHHLKEHFRIHSGERPYQCKTCGQRFKQSSTLKTHQKRHSGVSQPKFPSPYSNASPEVKETTDGRVHSYPALSPTMNTPRADGSPTRQVQSLPYMSTLQSVLLCGVPPRQGEDSGQMKSIYSDNPVSIHQPPAQITQWYTTSPGHHTSAVTENHSPDKLNSPTGRQLPPLIHWPSRCRSRDGSSVSPRFFESDNNGGSAEDNGHHGAVGADIEKSTKARVSGSPLMSQSRSPNSSHQNSNTESPNQSTVRFFGHIKVEPEESSYFASCDGESRADDEQLKRAGDTSNHGAGSFDAVSTDLDSKGSNKDTVIKSGRSEDQSETGRASSLDGDQSNTEERQNTNDVYASEHPPQDGTGATQLSEMNFANEDRFVCSLCGKVLSCAATLREHQRVCHGVGQAEPYLCQKCGRGFSNHSNFKRHQRLMHNEVKVRRHQCPVCLKAFPLGHHLKEHFRIHSGERPYKCEICGKGFTQSSTLKNHKKTHPVVGARDFQCDICDVRCDNALTLINHRMVHIVESCQCPGCGKKCSTPHQLALHRMNEYCPSRPTQNDTDDTSTRAVKNPDAPQEISA